MVAELASDPETNNDAEEEQRATNYLQVNFGVQNKGPSLKRFLTAVKEEDAAASDEMS